MSPAGLGTKVHCAGEGQSINKVSLDYSLHNIPVNSEIPIFAVGTITHAKEIYEIIRICVLKETVAKLTDY
jgi:hypothetical protein